MRGILPSGEVVVKERRRRIPSGELLRDRDDLIWDHRFGVRTRKGFGTRTAIEVAKVFGLDRCYVHAILRRMAKKRREQQLRRIGA